MLSAELSMKQKYNLGARYCLRTNGNELFCFV